MVYHRRIFRSLSGTLAAVILILLFISFFALTSYWYLDELKNVDQDYQDKQMITHEILKQSVIWIDRGISLYELQYEPDLTTAMEMYQQEYEISSGDPARIDYTGLQDRIEQRLNGTWNLYLIDTGVVTHTTFPDDRGLDFTQYPSLFEQYKGFIRNGNLVIDRGVMGFAPGAPTRKFAYQGTRDRRYLLEISRNIEQYRPATKASYRELAGTVGEVNPYLISVTIYNSQGDVVAGQSQPEEERESSSDTKKQVRKTFSAKNDTWKQYPDKKREVAYLFLPVEETGAPSTPMMHLVAKIVFTTEKMQHDWFWLTLLYIALLTITTCGGFLTAYLVSRHLTRPLNQIGDDVDQIAAGDLNHPIRSTGTRETERIEHSISRMVANLKENIESLNLSQDKLKKELFMRKKAEEQYWHLFDSARDAIFLLEDEVIKEANRQAQILLGRMRDKFIGKPLSDFTQIPEHAGSDGVTGDESESKKESLNLSLHPFHTSGFFNLTFIRPDGTVVETKTSINTIQIRDEIITQVIVRDVTELNELYRHEHDAISRLEENLVQLATINDNIRNPLTIIATIAGMLDEETEEKLTEQVSRIDQLVTNIDRGFIGTEKVRMYLRKHYSIRHQRLEDTPDNSEIKDGIE
ncbi:MAG: PAS domain-containing protein [Methanospirillaceae archaeon]|nr:PAS domain-containing protein [Methanospirillaceae archaeon]